MSAPEAEENRSRLTPGESNNGYRSPVSELLSSGSRKVKGSPARDEQRQGRPVEQPRDVPGQGSHRLTLEFSHNTSGGKMRALQKVAIARIGVQRRASPDKLMNMARGREYSAMERSIDVQISRLRRMLEEDPSKPRYIQTVWGLGYVFVQDGSDVYIFSFDYSDI